jgi:hypothetical protein
MKLPPIETHAFGMTKAAWVKLTLGPDEKQVVEVLQLRTCPKTSSGAATRKMKRVLLSMMTVDVDERVLRTRCRDESTGDLKVW